MLFKSCLGCGAQGGRSQSPTSCTPFSRLLYFFVPLSPYSRPLLCFTRYGVNHTVWLPILIRRALALSKIKNCCKSNHSATSSAIIKAAFLRHKLTPRGKMFGLLWTTVVRSKLPGGSSMEGFFPTTPKNTETDQNGLWGLLTWLALSFLQRIWQLVRQMRHSHAYDWHSRHTCTCVMLSHSCPMM